MIIYRHLKITFDRKRPPKPIEMSRKNSLICEKWSRVVISDEANFEVLNRKRCMLKDTNMRSIHLAMLYQDYKEVKARLEYGDVFLTKVKLSAKYISRKNQSI